MGPRLVHSAGIAERFAEPNVLLIRSFSDEADYQSAFSAIKDATQYGQIAVLDSERNSSLLNELRDRGYVLFGPFVGLGENAFAIHAIKEVRES